MSTVVEQPIRPATPTYETGWRERFHDTRRFLVRNPNLVWGLVLLIGLFLFAVIGALVTDAGDAYPLSAPPLLKPSAEYPFGTDRLGRDLFATIVTGVPLTFQIGLIAGLIGVTVGYDTGLFLRLLRWYGRHDRFAPWSMWG